MFFAYILIFIKLFLYFIFGILACELFKWSKVNPLEKELIGFFFYYLCFFVICIPCKLTLQSLSLLSILWFCAVFIIVLSVCIFYKKALKETINNLISTIKTNKSIIAIVAAITVFQIIAGSLNNNVIAKWDQAYYTGDVASSVYTDTISQYNSYTGNKLSILEPEYIFETYQNMSSVTCKIFGIHPLLEACTTMLTVIIILFNILLFIICHELTQNNRHALSLYALFTVLNIFSYNDANLSSMLYLRSYEGKGILVLLIMPFVFYYFIRTVKNNEDKTNYRKNLLIMICSFGLNMSSIYMIPFLVMSTYGSLIIVKKKKIILTETIKFVIPFAIMMALYIIFTKFIFIKIY